MDRSDATAVRAVGVGASAGGPAAIQQFLRSVPADSGLACVVVQHLGERAVGIVLSGMGSDGTAKKDAGSECFQLPLLEGCPPRFDMA